MTEKILDVRCIGLIARIADTLMVPIMYIVSGTFRESPQKTHAWNVQNLTWSEVKRLNMDSMVRCPRIEGAVAKPRRWSFLFHIPIFGGWRQYVVLDSQCAGVWHVGWLVVDRGAQISKVPLVGPVRMLIGAEEASFFAIDDSGIQVSISKIGEGRIGDRGPFSKVQLC